MLRFFFCTLAVFACSSSKSAPTAPAGKKTDGNLGSLFEMFNQRMAPWEEKQARVLSGGLGGESRAPEWSPDGQRIVFYTSHNGWWDIYTVDPDGSNETQLTRDGTGEWSPRFSPDGSKIMFISQRGGRDSVHIMDADGENEVGLTGGGSSEENPAWSPDSRRILYVSSPWVEDYYEDRGIYVMDADGSDKRLLTDHDYLDTDSSWSPDGEKIAFLSYRENGYELYVMDADGGNKQRLAEEVGRGPEWSPDGKHILYNRVVNRAHFNVFVVDVTTLKESQRTWGRSDDLGSVWSPDGKQIAFISNRSGPPFGDDWAVYIMDADGQNLRKLTDVPGLETYLSWSPDSKQIAFEVQGFNLGLGTDIYVVDVETAE